MERGFSYKDVFIAGSQPNMDQSGRGSLSSYYESVGSSVSSKDGTGGTGYQPVISRQESHPVISNTSPGPALVAQALSGIYSLPSFVCLLCLKITNI